MRSHWEVSGVEKYHDQICIWKQLLWLLRGEQSVNGWWGEQWEDVVIQVREMLMSAKVESILISFNRELWSTYMPALFVLEIEELRKQTHMGALMEVIF